MRHKYKKKNFRIMYTENFQVIGAGTGNWELTL